MVGQVCLDPGDQVGVVRTARVEPEHGRVTSGPSAVDRELDPIADWQILGLAHAEDIAGVHRLFENHLARRVDDQHRAIGRDLEGLVVAAVLLGGLRHQSDVRH